MRTVDSAACPCLERQALNDVAVPYVGWKSDGSSGGHSTGEGNSLQPQHRTCVEVEPCARRAEPAAVLDVIHGLCRAHKTGNRWINNRRTADTGFSTTRRDARPRAKLSPAAG